MTDEIVTQENTKLIAGWMGKEITIGNTGVFSGSMLVWEKEKREEYNLITNATQSREVEEKLLGLRWKIEGFNFGSDFKEHPLIFSLTKNINEPQKGYQETIEAKTLELVIYKAALWEAKKWIYA